MSTVVEEVGSTSFTISTVPGGEPLGMEDGAIPDENITSSSSASPAPPHLARLNGQLAWCAGKAEDCFLQVDLGSLHLVCAVATQGNPGGNRDYVKRYKLQYSADGENWTMYEENGNTIIEGNTDNCEVKRKDLDEEVVTRFVRFKPVDWYCWPCLRVELYGASLNINEKIAELQSEDGGGFVVEKVLVTTYETPGSETEQDEGSLKEQKMSECQYPVHIYTGDKWGAGTDANILITIYGEEGDSGEKTLDNNSSNFERGQKDSFTVTCGNLGRLTKIRIGHDNTGFGAAWYLDKVTVEDPNTGKAVDFTCQRWFSTSDDDGKISRELTRDDKDDETIVNKEETVDLQSQEGGGETVEECHYPVHIYTGDTWGAGTDANVLITVYGEEGDSGEKTLDNSSNNFERGQKDSFTISYGTYLGRLTKIRIGHDNTGFGAAWFLDKVTVEDPKTGKAVNFSCQRWFSTSEDDGKISRELSRDDQVEETIADKETNVELQPEEGGAETAGKTNVELQPEEEGAATVDKTIVELQPEEEGAATVGKTIVELQSEEEGAATVGKTIVELHPEEEGAATVGKTIVELQPEEEGAATVGKTIVELQPEEEGAATVGKTIVELQPEEEGAATVDKYQYPVHIYTGDTWGAGTDANVLITIYGEEGDSGEKTLDNSSNNFERGQKDSFTISCGTYLGRLTKIRIGHDNTGFGAAWFLDKVTVKDPNTGEAVDFSCQRWFATSEDDGKISRELSRDDQVEETIVDKETNVELQSEEGGAETADKPNVELQSEKGEDDTVDKYQYPVHIYTGDTWGAGTDANVLITIYGEEGDSGEKKLDNSSNNFERGQKDSFTISCGTYLGRLTKIRIGHDNTGFGAAWFLDKVTVEDPNTGEAVEFSCQRWFATSEDDGKISRELSRDDHVEETIVDKEYQYPVHIYTGDTWGAGTDANVLITIYGEDGDSGEKKLDSNSNNFERGQKDSFTFSCGTYLGRLTKIRIGHDNTGFGAAWFLDKVTVEDPNTGEAVDFSCQRWFATSEDDGKISRELNRDDQVEEKIVDKETNVELQSEEGGAETADKPNVELQSEEGEDDTVDKYQYPVHIYTGDTWGAGTDANVLITIYGEEGDSGEKKLDNSSNNFERGQKDSFTISCGTYLGRLTKIRIGHDNTGFGAAWFLDKVTVEDPNTGEAVEFSCQRWFATSEDDGKISRELNRDDQVEETIVDEEKNDDLQSEEGVPETVKEYQYPVHIYTGDTWGAGTDANVLITIYGEDGDSGEKTLDNSSNNFERAQKDSFTISCGNLGRLTKIRIGHDNTGFGAAWFLDKVTVEDPNTGETVDFTCQRWFSTSEDDGKISRELTRDDDIIVAKEEIADPQAEKEGRFDEENVLVTTNETHVDENGEPDQGEDSLKEQDDNMDKERMKAEASIKLILDEEKMLERREKPDGQDEPEEDVEERHSPVMKEYSRIEDEHRKRMEEIEAILGEDEERRRREKGEIKKAEQEARKQKEEERRQRDEELKRKREEERLKWEEEHKKWEEDRKKRDTKLQAVLGEGRKKREEERRKREEELKKNREEERSKREEERKKRMEEEKRKLEELRREREERWKKKTEVAVGDVDLTLQAQKEEEDVKNRQEEKKRKEEGWKKAVEGPRKIEEEMKKFRDEERKRLEEERKKQRESELAEEEKEKEFISEIRVIRRGETPATGTHVSATTVQIGPPKEVSIAEEKRRIEWRMAKIEQDRKLREAEEKKRREVAERKRKEEEERVRQEEERKRKEQEEERERCREELRLRREAEERKMREEDERKRQQEEIRRKTSLEEKRKRLEEDRKKREEEELVWRREMEERKQREEEERRKQMESKRIKRLSIERKKFEDDEKKRLDSIEHKRLEEEDRERREEEQRRREERERWKMKQAEKRRSGDMYRRKSEEDLRNREDRASWKERQRKKRDSKSFEAKWTFMSNGMPGNEPIPPTVTDISQSEPEIFVREKTKPDERDEKDSSTTPRISYQVSRDTLPSVRSETSLNGEVVPYRSQPRCDHLLPADPAVQMAEEESFFDKFEEEGKLRPFPSWYGSLDMGSLSHLYSPSNPITDSDIDQLLAIESEDFSSWKRVKKSRELEIYSRKGTKRGSPPVVKAIMVLKDVPYRDAIELVSDWDERTKWDKTFDGVSYLDQMADFKVLKCSQNKKNRCLVLATLDREDEEPYYAWAWKAANHPSVPGEDTKVTVLRLETGICGAIIRPYHDATRSSKITLIIQVRGSIPSPLKSTYLTGNPSKWLIWLKKHYESQLKTTAERDENDENRDDSSSASSK